MKTFRQYFTEKIYINLPSSRQQTNYTCGAVALRSIAKYYGKDLENEKAFADLCDSGKNKGAHPDDIVKAAKAFGFDAFVKQNMTIDELTNYVAHKIPVICCIQAWSNDEDDPQKKWKGYKELNDGHYVVAIGFDDKNIFFEDPSIKGKRPFIPRDEFLKRWHDREAYVDNPIRDQTGIIIKSHKKPEVVQQITKTQKLP